MTDNITTPMAPDVLDPVPHPVLAGDWSDDDSQVYDAEFEAADHGPVKHQGVPHPVPALKPANRLLSRIVNVGTINSTLADPIMVFPADPNRTSLSVVCNAAETPTMLTIDNGGVSALTTIKYLDSITLGDANAAVPSTGWAIYHLRDGSAAGTIYGTLALPAGGTVQWAFPAPLYFPNGLYVHAVSIDVSMRPRGGVRGTLLGGRGRAVIASSKSDCYSGQNLDVTEGDPVTLAGYTGALWAYSPDAAQVNVSGIAVTS